MLDADDVKKLTEVLATKEDVNSLGGRLDVVEETQSKIVATMSTKEGVALISDRTDELDEKLDRIIVILDGLAKRVEDMHAEYVAVRLTMERHERWIKELAEKAGVKLTA